MRTLRGVPPLFLDQSAARDSPAFQVRAKLLPARVRPESAEGHGAASQRPDVRRHVAGAARKTLSGVLIAHQDHWHGRLRRDARGLASQQLVQHEVAQHANRLAAELADNLRQTLYTLGHASGPCTFRVIDDHLLN